MSDELIIRQEAVPSKKYGIDPHNRPLNELINFGAVAIDKPSGPTSHQVAAYVQQILDIEKTGHAGTLDPKVTGVLPMGSGNATRLMEYLLKAGKQYVGIMHLHGDIPEYTVRKKMQEYIGTITQLPPKRSAVARRKRQRKIYSVEILEIRGRDILFKIDVEAGTYIRKYCHDFGELLGCGAHMAELRRTRASTYVEEDAVTLQQLTDAYHLAQEGNEGPFREIFRPGEELVAHLPKVVLLDSAVHSITHGATLKVPGIAQFSSDIKEGDIVQLLTLHGEIIAIGVARMSSDEMLGEKGVAVKPKKVFMSENVYPRMD